MLWGSWLDEKEMTGGEGGRLAGAKRVETCGQD